MGLLTDLIELGNLGIGRVEGGLLSSKGFLGLGLSQLGGFESPLRLFER